MLSVMSGLRFFEFDPVVMKQHSLPGATLGDSGQNLPSALQKMCAAQGREEILASWLRELTPMDVRGFRFPKDPYGNVYLEIVEARNRKIAANSASDGTLRFLAMLAVLLSADPAKVYFFEEIDNGLHPARLSLLVDLIENQTSRKGFQVVTTTHSPALLEMLGDESFGNTSIVYRDEESDYPTFGRSVDRRGTEENSGVGTVTHHRLDGERVGIRT